MEEINETIEKWKKQIEPQNQGEPQNREEKANTTSGAELTGRSSGTYTELEKQVAIIWGEVLGYAEIDVKADFFELGGDSILSSRIINTINKDLGTNLDFSDLFEYSTIEDFARVYQ